MLLPGPPSRMSSPGPPMRTSSPALPFRDVVAVATDEDVVPIAAAGREGNRTDRQPGGVHHVITTQRIDGQPVVRGLGTAMFTWAKRPITDVPLASPPTLIASASLVPLTITVSAWPSPVPVPGRLATSRLTWARSVPVRSLTVMVSARPGR